jgi:hypothetical protein
MVTQLLVSRSLSIASLVDSAGPFREFIEASVILTGFERFDLLGTGVAEEYFKFLQHAAENAALEQVCERVCGAKTDDDIGELLQDAQLGPLARNLIKLWYLGQWFGELPPGANSILSAESYKEGLVWRAIGAHPQGAKQQGFAAWSEPPNVDSGPERSSS